MKTTELLQPLSDKPVQHVLVSGYRKLPATSEHIVAANDLPQPDEYPSGCFLAAQARVESLLLLAAGKAAAKYGEGVWKA